MAQIRTYVFMDLETSGMPEVENNRTKIAELSMIAVKREHFLNTPYGESPLVQNKLTLCFNPCRLVQPEGTRITGLCNDLLEYEAKFDINSFELIDKFLSVLTKPVCFIAQNGNNFDYPILKNHLEKLNVDFTTDVRCADCFFAFYDILEGKTNSEAECSTPLTVLHNISTEDFNINKLEVNNGSVNASTSTKNSDHIIDSTVGSESLLNNSKENVTDSTEKISLKMNSAISDDLNFVDTSMQYLKDFLADDIVDCIFSNESEYMRKINETTPKRQTIVTRPRNIKKVKKRFPWSKGSRPNDSYKLGDIYKRQLHREAPEAHRAENDCIITLEIAVTVAEKFVEWVDNNNMAFRDVEAMKIGVKLG